MGNGNAKATIVYDGECGFCQNQIGRIRRMDRLDQFEYAPSQSADLMRRFPQLAGADFNSGMRLVLADGQVLVGADAVHGIARRLPRWRRIAWLYRVPVLHGISRIIYAWVAANRQKLGKTCADGTCEIPGKRP